MPWSPIFAFGVVKNCHHSLVHHIYFFTICVSSTQTHFSSSHHRRKSMSLVIAFFFKSRILLLVHRIMSLSNSRRFISSDCGLSHSLHFFLCCYSRHLQPSQKASRPLCKLLNRPWGSFQLWNYLCNFLTISTTAARIPSCDFSRSKSAFCLKI